MKIKPQDILYPVLMGVGAFILLFPVLSALLTPQWFYFFSGVLFYLLGVWLGSLQPQSLWYAPLLLNLVPGLLMLSFPFLVPHKAALSGLGIMLLASYLGMLLGSRFTLAAEGDARLHHIGEVLSHYLLPLAIGFFALAVMPLSWGLVYATGHYWYFLLFPATYLLLVVLFARLREWWLSDALLLFLAPWLYWMVFVPLRQYGKGLPLSPFAQGMLFVMPVIVLLAVLAAYIVHLRKSAH
jgi:hypothetical protein